MPKLVIVPSCFLLLSTCAGCMDGPFYTLKKANPYFLSEWREDRMRGPTYEERIAELKSIEGKITGMGPTEQEEWAMRLEGVVKDDPSPEMRRQAVRCVAQLNSPTATRVLNMASADEVDKVRLAACDAWAQRKDAAAQNMLVSLAVSDEDNSVRQAAISGLAGFNDPSVLRTLGELLNDKSPAVQYNVAQSLASITGEDHGGDVAAWKNYLNDLVPMSGSAEQPQVLTASGAEGLPPFK